MARSTLVFDDWMTEELAAMLPALDDAGMVRKAAEFRAEIAARAMLNADSPEIRDHYS